MHVRPQADPSSYSSSEIPPLDTGKVLTGILSLEMSWAKTFGINLHCEQTVKCKATSKMYI
ncbi:hypothetical protein E2C01_068644 [Portunus trituberculatus]|uniref:Uncharacterized protein n=1 Tax=Portunus trituberculatus TaxID=210409 RepID=A0A5B7HYG0_PORTR|nr:hypothetical protein [Portunus trituberculatus]